MDKDFDEINAIKTFCCVPTQFLSAVNVCKCACVQVSVQLCIFRVLKAIRKEVLKLVPKEKQQKVYSIIHSLIYTRSSDNFDNHLQKLNKYEAFDT